MALIALLDTDVLWPITLCSTLLRLAEAELYEVAFSEAILEELERTLKEKLGQRGLGNDLAGIDRRIAAMRAAFSDHIVTGYEDLVPAMKNDAGDRHVLAAAIWAKAGVIVTNNVRHFPAEACAPYQIEVLTADEFLCYLWSFFPQRMAEILKAQAASYRMPPMTVHELLERLHRASCR